MPRDNHHRYSTTDESESKSEVVVTPPPDDLYHVLAGTLRRRLLAHLLENPELSFDEAADVLAGWSAASEGDVVTPSDRERIETELHHVHLPMLDEAGLLTYDHDAEEIRRAALADAVVEVIYTAIDYDQATSQV
ncbi:DUF7344 domain-containing protein [Haloarchaeobius sp. HRN-SO-5]|uniref:DUF7344 domain-containing protein n=1 Tax=Haloarchaeobius sp. HRN-SO-5 TaxID=3446118 RepID=UPI003EBCC8AB